MVLECGGCCFWWMIDEIRRGRERCVADNVRLNWCTAGTQRVLIIEVEDWKSSTLIEELRHW